MVIVLTSKDSPVRGEEKAEAGVGTRPLSSSVD